MTPRCCNCFWSSLRGARLEAGDDLIQHLEDDHLTADIGEQAGELAADYATPDDPYSVRAARASRGRGPS